MVASWHTPTIFQMKAVCFAAGRAIQANKIPFQNLSIVFFCTDKYIKLGFAGFSMCATW